MICPKCKTKVSKNDTVCPTCKLKLIFKCSKCGSPTRLGSVSCKKCGNAFVKFCPECNCANIPTATACRKCSYKFEKSKIQEEKKVKFLENRVQQEPQEKKKVINITQEISTNATIGDVSFLEKDKNKEQEENKPFLFYIDFINLDKFLEKYNKKEFEHEVIQNIKTTIKIAFGVNCEFINSHVAMFSLNYNKQMKILDKIGLFEQEFSKFNQILEKKLDSGLSYKFAISTAQEVRKSSEIIQLKHGCDKDVIVSSGAYSKLSSELSLIKITSDSYKLIFLEQRPVFEQAKDVKYDKALEMMLESLSDNASSIRAISLNAQRGAGKTHLLSDLYNKLYVKKPANTIVFHAQCSALTQVSPYGLIQNFFSTLFNCPAVLREDFNINGFEKKVLDRLQLDKIDKDHLETLANLIYPIKKDYYENILINKEITYRYLKDVFDYIKQKKNLIFIIDDFDLIDESSYGFLKFLVTENYFERDAKLVLGYKNQHSISMYFQTDKLNNNNCLNISLRSLNSSESKIFIKKVLGQECQIPNDILSHVAYNAQGNIAYIEQILQYFFERRILLVKDGEVIFNKEFADVEIPATLEKVFCERLDFLRENNEKEYIFLNVASLLGDRLDYRLLSGVFQLTENEFFEIVNLLEKKGYLKRKVDDIYGFKNSLTWSYCYIKAKEEDLIKEDAKKLLLELNDKTISTPLICPILAQVIGNKDLAFSLWTKNLQYASYIGDVNIYTMAQKQSLILLENVKLDNFEYTKNNICERLGKLIYDKNPSEAKEYLSVAIAAAQKNHEINKIIELTGYLAKSSYLTQDYNAVVEVVDNVLKFFNKHDKTDRKSTIELQIALIKTRKLEALLQLGSWQEISSLVNTEITPVLEKHLNFFSKHKWISQSEIFYSWIEANIILAQSYAQQGSSTAFELISEIDKVLQKERGTRIDMLRVKLAFADAMASTSRGFFDESDTILQEIVKDYSYVIDNPNLICDWNIINLINKILRGELISVKEDLFEATTYANNCNDEVAKNFLKTLLAYVMLEEKSYVKAIEIATAQMQYFSSKKLALGALLAWYISASATSANKADMYCIEICEKAVKICENAHNNNYFFKILFQELLAKTYLKLGNKDNAQMYCDLALQTAQAQELLYLQVRLNELKANISNERLIDQVDSKKVEHAQNTIKMYGRAIDSAKKLNLSNYTRRIEKELTAFRAHCQLNRILEEK